MTNKSDQDILSAAEALHGESNNIPFLEHLLDDLNKNGIEGEAYKDALDLLGILPDKAALCDAAEPWQLGFQDAASPMMQGIIDLHHDIFFFLILILVFVSRILVRALWHFHYQKNPIPQRIVHGTTIEILRTIFPSIIPMFIAIPSFALLYSMDEVVVMFTWFSNLRPNSITTWAQLETAFHAQFYLGDLNVAVTDLVVLKLGDGETIDESRCYLSLPESEVVKIAIMRLGFYMRQKLLNVHISDLAHLAERVRQVEILKKEKEKYKNEMRLKSIPFSRKEKVSYVAMESSIKEFDLDAEVDLAELRKDPPYVYSLLKKIPSNDKSNYSKLKSGKRYSFDISKSE
ncbi:hypothetical protein AHAS_Ahas06G0215900 [Arachis hypogaea]